MNRKGLNFKSAIFKIFFTYLGVYFLALIFKYNYDLESLFNNIQYKYLITLNIVSIFFGLPLSIIFDFILIKIFGLNYVLYFSPALTILSVIQVLILRNIKFKFSRNILFLKKPEKNNFYKFFDNITFKSTINLPTIFINTSFANFLNTTVASSLFLNSGAKNFFISLSS